jgi:hypothetical protein
VSAAAAATGVGVFTVYWQFYQVPYAKPQCALEPASEARDQCVSSARWDQCEELPESMRRRAVPTATKSCLLFRLLSVRFRECFEEALNDLAVPAQLPARLTDVSLGLAQGLLHEGLRDSKLLVFEW